MRRAPWNSRTRPRFSVGRISSTRFAAGVDVDVTEQAGADGGERVEHVVAADEVKVNIAAQLFNGENKARAIEATLANLFGANVGSRIGSVEKSALAHAAREGGDAVVVGVEDGVAVGRECGDELELGARDAGDSVREELEMHGCDVGDDAPVGLGDLRERGDLAGVIHAHLEHGDLVLRLKAEQVAEARRSGC